MSEEWKHSDEALLNAYLRRMDANPRVNAQLNPPAAAPAGDEPDGTADHAQCLAWWLSERASREFAESCAIAWIKRAQHSHRNSMFWCGCAMVCLLAAVWGWLR